MFACNQNEKANNQSETETDHEETTEETSDHEEHWSYDGETSPEHWDEILKDSDCDGMYQSPINITNYIQNDSLQPVKVFFKDSTMIHEVLNNGHTIQYNFKSSDYIMFDDVKYYIKQFHFHEPEEHLIDGVRYPLAVHMVHMSEDGGYAVVAVMAKEGERSKTFDVLEEFLPVQVGETKVIDKIVNLKVSFPENKSYFHYIGSLTTPPCTENVKWFVMKDPINISLEQANVIRELMPLNNYRDQQPINGRNIKLYSE
nr:carbonic anhydrase family protein [Marinigracilibium pacificum]